MRAPAHALDLSGATKLADMHRDWLNEIALAARPAFNELVRSLDKEGRELARTETGSFDRHIWRKAARPDVLNDGDYIYQDIARLEEQPDGTILSTVTVVRRWNDAVFVPEERSPKLDETEKLEAREDGRPETARPAKPLSGFGLVLHAVWASLARPFRRG